MAKVPRVKKRTLVERIDDVLNAKGEPIHWCEVENAVFPDDKSHRYQANGGPPGCRMAFSAALRRGNFQTKHLGGTSSNCLIYPRKARVIELVPKTKGEER